MIRWLSVVDLLSFEESKGIVQKGDNEEFKKLLFDVGFDVERGLEYQVCLHRPLSYVAANKNPVNTGRWVSSERRDKEWMESEHCTYENRLEEIGTRDLGFQRELVAMSQLPNFTALACDHLKDNSVEGW